MTGGGESVFAQVAHALRDEFADLDDPAAIVRVVMRLTVAAVLGGALGYQREALRKAAGLRTHILVAMGSALFVLVPQQMGASPGDMTRVLQGLVAGIGFLGTGAIVKGVRGGGGGNGDGEVTGLTTAAGIWMTAAIGMSVGLGREMTAILATLFALVVLAILPKHVRVAESASPKRRAVAEPAPAGAAQMRREEEEGPGAPKT